MKSPFFGFSQVTKVYFWPGNGSTRAATITMTNGIIDEWNYNAYSLTDKEQCARHRDGTYTSPQWHWYVTAVEDSRHRGDAHF